MKIVRNKIYSIKLPSNGHRPSFTALAPRSILQAFASLMSGFGIKALPEKYLLMKPTSYCFAAMTFDIVIFLVFVIILFNDRLIKSPNTYFLLYWEVTVDVFPDFLVYGINFRSVILKT